MKTVFYILLSMPVENYYSFYLLIVNIWFKFVLLAIALCGGGNVL